MRIASLTHLAVAAAARGAEVHTEGHDAGHWIATRASPTNLSEAVEDEAELKIVELIQRHRPDDAILSQGGIDLAGTSGVLWIIDPLDGTANYYVGYPAHAVTIGVEVDGEPSIGVVHDTAAGAVYQGSIEQHAHVDGHPIHVKGQVPLERAVVATGFAPIPKYREIQAEVLAHVLPRIGDLRRSGSPSLDLCAVAAGRLNGFFEMGLPRWDYAAGVEIVRAADGAVEVIETAPDWPGPVVAAGHPAIVADLLAMGAEAGIPML